jgi:hypothetical protein
MAIRVKEIRNCTEMITGSNKISVRVADYCIKSVDRSRLVVNASIKALFEINCSLLWILDCFLLQALQLISYSLTTTGHNRFASYRLSKIFH